MEYVVDGARRFVSVVSHENPTFFQWRATLEAAIADPAFQPGFGFLSDRRAVREPASTRFIRDLARYASERRDVFTGVRWAVVVDTPVGYGMARMGKALVSDDLRMEVEIFRDLSQAVEWLSEKVPAASSVASG
jgi:hypothetical protein